jgi:hypothetical protein
MLNDSFDIMNACQPIDEITNNNWVDLNQGTIRFVLKHVSILHVCVYSFLASRFCLIYLYKCLDEMWVSRESSFRSVHCNVALATRASNFGKF